MMPSRKRPRSGSSKNEQQQQQQQQQQQRQTVLTPHAKRLLKLIEEGTAEHAKLAASHLTSMAASCSPVVLWDMLGHLQGFLVQTNWKARQHASLAMQGVATCLPPKDQAEFLQKKQEHDGILWWTVQDLEQQLDTVLEKGRHLLATSSSVYDDQEERGLQALEGTDAEEFLERRIRYQRHVLARRMGLASIVEATRSTEVLPSITKEDLLPIGSHDSRLAKETLKRNRSDKKKREGNDNNLPKSIHALLVSEIKRTQRSHNTSHKNPQTLLATELLYRMLDADWDVRHGALLGLSGLLRAWKRNDGFGAWPHDILARALCVLALDRFGDFGEDGLTAPVRETAAQVVVLLHNMAPSDCQEGCRRVLERLCRYEASWEVRHGGIIALQYLVAIPRQESGLMMAQVNSVAVQRLGDTSDDVKAGAAKTLLLLLNLSPGNIDIVTCAIEVWKVLGGVGDVSACANNIVQLFAELVCTKPNEVVQAIRPGITTILSKLQSFLHYQSSVVRTTAYSAIAKALSTSPEVIDESTVAVIVNVAVDLFGTFCSVNQLAEADDVILSRMQKAKLEAWKALVEHSGQLLPSRNQLEVVHRLCLCFFCLPVGSHPATSIGLCELTVAADALSELVAHRTGLRDYLTKVLVAVLSSPWSQKYVAGCLLIRAISHSVEGLPTWLNAVIEILKQHLVELPLCVRVGANSLLGDVKLRKVFDLATVNLMVAASKLESTNGPEEALVSLRKATFEARKGPTVSATSVSVESMRVMALISGTMAAAGARHFPPKVTPLIRALMTAIKSEAEKEHIDIVCVDMQFLLVGLTTVNLDARDKVLENLCKLIIEGKRPICQSAGSVVTAFVSKLEQSSSLDSIAPVWNFLSPLFSSRPADAGEERLREALAVLCVVCRACFRGAGLTTGIINGVATALVLTACNAVQKANRELAVDTMMVLCAADPCAALKGSLPTVVKQLDSEHVDAVRIGAARLLHRLLEGVGMESSPFVKPLLPVVMSMMTDPLTGVAKEASYTFARLVRMAPLVRENEAVDLRSATSNEHSQGVVDHLIHGKPLDPVPLPATLEQELRESGVCLRRYQQEGVAWLHFLQSVHLNGALCDEMGLGKTLQALVSTALAHACFGDSFAQSLVICPSTLVCHWVQEIKRFFPSDKVFRVCTLLGNPSQRKKVWQDNHNSCNLFVTSYASLRTSTDLLTEKIWQYCILDEGHLLKNPATATARAARLLRSRYRLILTGTPVQNHVHELWATFDFLMPNFLGSRADFTKEFARPIVKGQQLSASADAISHGMEKLKILHQQVLPFILRREKGQVLKELPPKTITNVPCTLTEKQKSIYKLFCERSSVRESLTVLDRALGSGEGQDQSGTFSAGSMVLRSLLYLRLLCTHPRLVEQHAKTASENVHEPSQAQLNHSGKLIVLNDLLRSAQVCPDEMTAADNDASSLYIDHTEESSEPTQDILSNDHEETMPPITSGSSESNSPVKCLIFAQFTQSLDVVEKYLFECHMPALRYVRLDGRVPAEKRAPLVEEFNEDPSIKVMLLTTRVGGLGLNLTGASMVVFLEHDYNPHSDLQAMDRAHRIGQTRTVNVYRLITTGTIEEKIMALQKTKLQMSNAIVTLENSSLYSMGTDRLLDIFTFRSDQSKRASRGSQQEKNIDMSVVDDIYNSEYSSLSVDDFVQRLGA